MSVRIKFEKVISKILSSMDSEELHKSYRMMIKSGKEILRIMNCMVLEALAILVWKTNNALAIGKMVKNI